MNDVNALNPNEDDWLTIISNIITDLGPKTGFYTPFLTRILYRPLFNSGVRRYPPPNWGVLVLFSQFLKNPEFSGGAGRGPGSGFGHFPKIPIFRIFDKMASIPFIAPKPDF